MVFFFFFERTNRCFWFEKFIIYVFYFILKKKIMYIKSSWLLFKVTPNPNAYGDALKAIQHKNDNNKKVVMLHFFLKHSRTFILLLEE